MRYKIIHGSSELKIEKEMNDAIRDGYILKSFHTTALNSYVYCHVIMEQLSCPNK